MLFENNNLGAEKSIVKNQQITHTAVLHSNLVAAMANDKKHMAVEDEILSKTLKPLLAMDTNCQNFQTCEHNHKKQFLLLACCSVRYTSSFLCENRTIFPYSEGDFLSRQTAVPIATLVASFKFHSKARTELSKGNVNGPQRWTVKCNEHYSIRV